MYNNRITSVVEDTWGKATIYSQEKSESALVNKPNVPLKIALSEVHEVENRNTDDYLADKEADELSDNVNLNTLPYLQSSLFGSILEDAITQLRILVECNNELRIIKAKSDWAYLMAVKYGIRQPTTVDELEGIDRNNLDCDVYKIYKLDADRKYITDVITATYVDLSLYKGFTALEHNVNSIIARDSYRLSLVEEEAKNKVLRRDLNKQLRQQRNHIKSVIYDTDAKIEDLKSQVEDSFLVSECQDRYIDNWQRARTEQHLQRIHDNESVYCETVEYFKQRTDHEQRVHVEIEMLTNIKINETLQKVEDWMNKYDADMEGLDLKIQIKKNDYQNMRDKRVDLEKTIEKHDKLMKEWNHFKEEREKARQYVEKMTKSAITVQAWWRGLLVRKQLGPYKVTKKGKGPPGKKK